MARISCGLCCTCSCCRRTRRMWKPKHIDSHVCIIYWSKARLMKWNSLVDIVGAQFKLLAEPWKRALRKKRIPRFSRKQPLPTIVARSRSRVVDPSQAKCCLSNRVSLLISTRFSAQHRKRTWINIFVIYSILAQALVIARSCSTYFSINCVFHL